MLVASLSFIAYYEVAVAAYLTVMIRISFWVASYQPVRVCPVRSRPSSIRLYRGVAQIVEADAIVMPKLYGGGPSRGPDLAAATRFRKALLRFCI